MASAVRCRSENSCQCLWARIFPPSELSERTSNAAQMLRKPCSASFPPVRNLDKSCDYATVSPLSPAGSFHGYFGLSGMRVVSCVKPTMASRDNIKFFFSEPSSTMMSERIYSSAWAWWLPIAAESAPSTAHFAICADQESNPQCAS